MANPSKPCPKCGQHGRDARRHNEHLACAIKADQPLSKAAYDAIFEAERSGVA